MVSFQAGEKVQLMRKGVVAVLLSGRFDLHHNQDAVVEDVFTYIDGHKAGQQFARIVWYISGRRHVAGVSVENLKYLDVKAKR